MSKSIRKVNIPETTRINFVDKRTTIKETEKMVESVITILTPLYYVRATIQIKYVVSFKKWKQITRRIILLLSTMAKTPTIATSISCVDDGIYVSGLPP